MNELQNTSIISFEVGDKCNLKKLHSKCPINYRNCKASGATLTEEKINCSIDEAVALGFNGYFAFHYYNEPLLYADEIERIICKHSNCKFLLWTNGMLLDRNVENNLFLKLFQVVYISCYFQEQRGFFEQIKEWHGNVGIINAVLDNRREAYTREYINRIGCKRPLFELPIDYYGEVHLCCLDWNNTHKLGNIIETSLTEVVTGERYQKLLASIKNKLLDAYNCPDICKKCNEPWLRYTRYEDISCDIH